MWRNNIVENFFEGKCGNIVIEKFWKNYMLNIVYCWLCYGIVNENAEKKML